MSDLSDAAPKRNGSESLRWAFGHAAWILAAGILSVQIFDRVVGRLPLSASSSEELGQEIASGPPNASAAHRTITLTSEDGELFYLDGRINDVPVRFLVDTDATHVELHPEIAKRAGIPLNDHGVRGSGESSVTLRRLQVGPLALHAIPARVVDGPAIETVRLGKSVLRHLRGYEVRGDRLVIRW